MTSTQFVRRPDPGAAFLPVLDGEIVAIDLDAVQDAMLTSVRTVRLASVLVRVAAPTRRKRGLLRRLYEDPYWVLLTAAILLQLTIVGVGAYGIITTVVAIGAWFQLDSNSVLIVGVSMTVCALCVGSRILFRVHEHNREVLERIRKGC